jgi:hypothetical protein
VCFISLLCGGEYGIVNPSTLFIVNKTVHVDNNCSTSPTIRLTHSKSISLFNSSITFTNVVLYTNQQHLLRINLTSSNANFVNCSLRGLCYN